MKVLYSFCILILLNAYAYSQDNFKLLFYLEGKWVIEKSDHSIHEEWEKVSDTLLTAVSFYVKDDDTTNAESVSLVKKEDGIYYIPVVKHNDGPVKFKLTSLTENKAVFENPGHDFPTKIIYERINNDSLKARIEGLRNGELKGIDYPYKRVN